MNWSIPKLSPQLREQAVQFLDDPQAPQTMSADLFLDLIVEPHLIDLAEQFDNLRPMADYPNRRMYVEQLAEASAGRNDKGRCQSEFPGQRP